MKRSMGATTKKQDLHSMFVFRLAKTTSHPNITNTHTQHRKNKKNKFMGFSLGIAYSFFLYVFFSFEERVLKWSRSAKLRWSRFGFIEFVISLICFVWRTVCWFSLDSSFFSQPTIIPNLSPTIALLMQFFYLVDVNHRCNCLPIHLTIAMKPLLVVLLLSSLLLMLMLIFVVQNWNVSCLYCCWLNSNKWFMEWWRR